MTALTSSFGQSSWRVVYELLRSLPMGAIVSDEQLAQRLGVDHLYDRPGLRLALSRAAVELRVRDRRAVTLDPQQGYRIIDPLEQLVSSVVPPMML